MAARWNSSRAEVEASQAHVFKAMVSLEMRKLHLDLLPLIAGLVESRRTHERASMVTSFFVHVARHLAPGGVRAAPRLQRARIASALARPIQDRAAIMRLARCTQHLVVRAPIRVLLFVE